MTSPMITPQTAPRTAPSGPITKKASIGLVVPGIKSMQPMNPMTRLTKPTLIVIVAHHQPTALPLPGGPWRNTPTTHPPMAPNTPQASERNLGVSNPKKLKLMTAMKPTPKPASTPTTGSGNSHLMLVLTSNVRLMSCLSTFFPGRTSHMPFRTAMTNPTRETTPVLFGPNPSHLAPKRHHLSPQRWAAQEAKAGRPHGREGAKIVPRKAIPKFKPLPDQGQ